MNYPIMEIKYMRKVTILILAIFVSYAYADDIYHDSESEKTLWPFEFDLPVCDDYYVLRKIMHDFQSREKEFWASDLFISEFAKVNQTGLRTFGRSYIPRRYCQSEALFGDGVKRMVYYSITPDQSVILTGQVIDWCVVGLDRTHVNGPNCQRVRD